MIYYLLIIVLGVKVMSMFCHIPAGWHPGWLEHIILWVRVLHVIGGLPFKPLILIFYINIFINIEYISIILLDLKKKVFFWPNW